TSLPWAVKFPQGYPPSTAGNLAHLGIASPPGTDPTTVLAVHPTQLYEVAIMLVAFAFLWRWRKLAHPAGWLFGAYLVWAGAERFFVEIFRAKDDRFFGPFTIAQVVSVALVLLGLALAAKWRRGESPAPGPWLSAVNNQTPSN
ncbi:MAG TPA: prolipoprotein diacylglyceryl transferase family protein, partial [Gemmatimonadales bacterium]|nr:prolipoprotein diacylglyceryl transferase family protein [Gemmatimonadales bacterium]